MTHDEATLIGFLEGTLPPSEAHDFDAHLLGCESCWAAVRQSRAGRDALQSLQEVAPSELRNRVRLAVQAASSATGGHEVPGPPVRRHRRARLALALVAVVALTTVAGTLITHHGASSGDPASVAAVVEFARLPSPLPPDAANGSDATSGVRGPILELGRQKVRLARHQVDGREVLVASSDQAFPMPGDARSLGEERGAPWLAQRGALALACLSQPTHLLLVGPLPAERLVELGRELAPR